MRALLALLFLLLARIETARGELLAATAITRAQQVPASRLDPALPDRPFAAWLQALVGPGARIRWESNDCVEQTGTPADAGRDIPLCAEVDAILPDGRTVQAMIGVGTAGKGVVGEPALYSLTIQHAGRFQTVRRLRDLPAALGRK